MSVDNNRKQFDEDNKHLKGKIVTQAQIDEYQRYSGRLVDEDKLFGRSKTADFDD